MYYNYHAIAKRLILENNTIGATIFSRYKHISPALVLYFKNHAPIPIRQYMWQDYFLLLKQHGVTISNPDKVNVDFN